MPTNDFTTQTRGIVLRPYQSRAVADVLKQLRSGNHTVLVAPTGSGKTVIAARIAKRYPNVLLVAHRMEIIEQAKRFGIRAMSVPSALRRGPKKVDLLIIDEAHRSAAETYRQLIKRYAKSVRLGLTATPMRTDGQGLCDAFTALVQSSSMDALIEAGHLVPYRAFEAPDEALEQLSSMKRIGGDYAARQLSDLMSRPRLVGDVVREYRKNAIGRRAIVFAVSVEHSKALAWAFRADGIRAIHIDGHASEKVRTDALRQLAEGMIDVLCNVNLFTEGWDCPEVACVVMARPTTSLTLYLQSVGRGMRTCQGKHDVIILDHAGNIERHGRPDEPREWSLESQKQKTKRESEVAELERLHALGFESIDAELEEKQRIRETLYSTEEIRRLHLRFSRVARGKLSDFLRTRGVNPNSGNCGSIKYLKTDVDALVAEMSKKYSAAECKALLKNFCRGQLSSFLDRRGIKRTSGWSRAAEYQKCDIDALLQSLEMESYTAAECAEKLKASPKTIAQFLRRRGVESLTGHGQGSYTRYPKNAIDRLVSERVNTEVLTEAERRERKKAVAHRWYEQHKTCPSLSVEEKAANLARGRKERWDAYYKLHPDKLKAQRAREAKTAISPAAVEKERLKKAYYKQWRSQNKDKVREYTKRQDMRKRNSRT